MTTHQKKADGPTNDEESVKLFMRLVDQFSYQQGENARHSRLTNFTFFAGAGFSKSWDPNAPVGNDLFMLKTDVIERVANIGALARMFGLNFLEEISPSQLRQMVYQIDMYERYPDVRPRYVDEQNIRMFRGALRAAVIDRYCNITNLNYFDRKIGKFPINCPTEKQRNILRFFRHLHARIDGSQDLVEGIRTHFVTTNYDFVIETIIDNILDPEDTSFLYTYRGFTPSHIADERNLTLIHDHWLAQHLLKINGGFEIFRRGGGYALDYSQKNLSDLIAEPPILMLASREQDYSDPYFKTVFPKAIRLLRESTVLVIVGYSLPQDDALIRFFVRQFAEESEDGYGKFIFYVGPGKDQDKRDILSEVFPSMNLGRAPRLLTYNQGFDSFTSECLELSDPTFS